MKVLLKMSSQCSFIRKMLHLASLLVLSLDCLNCLPATEKIFDT